MFKRGNQGFSLIEICVSLVVIGSLVAAGAYSYQMYKRSKLVKETQDAVTEAHSAIDNFRTLFGRYPCPARIDRVPGDADYGFEDYDAATGTCNVSAGITVANSANTDPALTDKRIYIGTLPFRQLNIADIYVHDGYNNRIAYAVSGMMVDANTYEDNLGAITIEDRNNSNLLRLPHTAHFVVYSSGEDSQGAVSKLGGAIGACPNPATEVQGHNCNGDEKFVYATTQNGYDDVLRYTSADRVDQWQIAENDTTNIHLRRSSGLVAGLSASGTPDTSVVMDVKSIPNYEGRINAAASATNTDEGNIYVDRVCNADKSKCFKPSYIGGKRADGQGVECPAGQYLTKFVDGETGTIGCTDTVELRCPAGALMKGIDPATGAMRCELSPGSACPAQAIPGTCGDTRTVISDTYADPDNDGNFNWYGFAYTGKCHKFNPGTFSTAVVSALNAAVDMSEVNTIIDGINADVNARGAYGDCGSTSADALVRDTFECRTNGTWDTTPIQSIERGNVETDMSSFNPVISSSSSYVLSSKEVTHIPWTAYDPNNPMAINNLNKQTGANGTDHDCFCREDYIVETKACGNSLGGFKFRVMHHPCPQTSHYTLNQVYPSSGWDDSQCTCTPHSGTETQACRHYFGIPQNSVSGNVSKPYNVTCSGNNPTKTYGTVDTSNCVCPSQTTPIMTQDACPAGTTNTFVYNGITYTGVKELYQQNWICPTGIGGNVASASDKGYYDTITSVHTEPCTCDASIPPRVETEGCATGESGQKIYHIPWDCNLGTTGGYPPRDPSHLVSDTCSQCRWHADPMSKQPGTSIVGTLHKKGSECPSCSGLSAACHETAGEGSYDIWTCTCYGAPPVTN